MGIGGSVVLAHKDVTPRKARISLTLLSDFHTIKVPHNGVRQPEYEERDELPAAGAPLPQQSGVQP